MAKLMIMLAYDVQESQIQGADGWVNVDRWIVDAKATEEASKNMAFSPGETRLMLQNMLKERFSLRVHTGVAEQPAYVLTVSRRGSRLKAPEHPGATNIRVNGNSIVLEAGDISRLTQLLSGAVGRPVVDETGLTGQFDARLQWDEAPVANGGLIGSIAPAEPDYNRGSIFTAIEEQLGLRLISKRVEVQTIVIDQIKLPTEN